MAYLFNGIVTLDATTWTSSLEYPLGWAFVFWYLLKRAFVDYSVGSSAS